MQRKLERDTEYKDTYTTTKAFKQTEVAGVKGGRGEISGVQLSPDRKDRHQQVGGDVTWYVKDPWNPLN